MHILSNQSVGELPLTLHATGNETLSKQDINRIRRLANSIRNGILTLVFVDGQLDAIDSTHRQFTRFSMSPSLTEERIRYSLASLV